MRVQVCEGLAGEIADVVRLEFLLWIRFSIRLYKIHWGNKESHENVQCNTQSSSTKATCTYKHSSSSESSIQWFEIRCDSLYLTLFLSVCLSFTSKYTTHTRILRIPLDRSIQDVKNVQHQLVPSIRFWSHQYKAFYKF